MGKRRFLSAARAELFELFDEVAAHEGAKVILARRGSDRRAVLVSESYLSRLEHASAPAFRLFGSLEALVDDPLETVRRDGRAKAAVELRSLE